MIDNNEIGSWFQLLQDEICSGIAEIDGNNFKEDNWNRPGGGGGRTRILTNGAVIEKGGVNFSAVFGKAPEFLLAQHNIKNPSAEFYATGVSIVMHPQNPFVPIIHMNVRFLRVDSKWWFGGGIDLTPHYVKQDDAKFFHACLKTACDKHGKELYEDYKKQADDYFFIKHRNETRGIGGIFFDHLSGDENTFTTHWNFVKEIGKTFLPTYIELIRRNRNEEFDESNSNWQRLRRGRYVEFNLLYDRGTKFGLDTNGRTESILMSLPPLAAWEYDFIPKAGSAEAETQSLLIKDLNWLG
jgi:coproporphyrinogen III oxidase